MQAEPDNLVFSNNHEQAEGTVVYYLQLQIYESYSSTYIILQKVKNTRRRRQNVIKIVRYIQMNIIWKLATTMDKYLLVTEIW